MLTIVAFVLTLGVLITVHEYGHFQVARWCGVKVLRFSIGFGKPLFTKKFGIDQTEFVLAAFPLGGYVKMLDEREESSEGVSIPEPDLPRAFNRQPVWKRMLIVLAGPVANFLLAIILYWLVFMSGVIGVRPILGEVEQGTPAALASMKAGELINKVAGQSVSTWQDVQWILLEKSLKSKSVQVEAVNEGKEVHLHQLQLMIGDKKNDFEGDFLGKLGLRPYQPAMPAKVEEVVKGSAAEKAGLEAGDEVLMVDGISVGSWEDFVSIIRKSPEQKLTLRIIRSGNELTLPIVPDLVSENGQKMGRVGAASKLEKTELDKLLVEVKYSPLASFNKAVVKTWETSIFSLRMLGNMMLGNISWKGVSGPVTIASYAGQSAHMGIKAFLGFLAVISISLGVLNLLPIPVLDGGHLMYYTVEIFKGSPVSEQAMEIGQRIGMALLGLLMACAIYNDFNRLITG